MVLQQSVVESLLGFTAAVAEQCGDLLDGQSVDLEVGCCCCWWCLALEFGASSICSVGFFSISLGTLPLVETSYLRLSLKPIQVLVTRRLITKNMLFLPFSHRFQHLFWPAPLFSVVNKKIPCNQQKLLINGILQIWKLLVGCEPCSFSVRKWTS